LVFPDIFGKNNNGNKIQFLFSDNLWTIH
jgi:hypothetical protein